MYRSEYLIGAITGLAELEKHLLKFGPRHSCDMSPIGHGQMPRTPALLDPVGDEYIRIAFFGRVPI